MLYDGISDEYVVVWDNMKENWMKMAENGTKQRNMDEYGGLHYEYGKIWRNMGWMLQQMELILYSEYDIKIT